MVAEESQRYGGRENDDCAADYSQDFDVGVRVDEVTNGLGEHSLQGVMEDVETVAVFPEEAQGSVLEEMLGDRGWAQRHGDEGGRGDADDAEPQGGDEEAGLPHEAVIDGGNADKDRCSNSEDAGGEFEDTPSG